jgi:hypothetical protein
VPSSPWMAARFICIRTSSTGAEIEHKHPALLQPLRLYASEA